MKRRDKTLIYGVLPREDIRPTDLAPIMLPDDDFFAITQMRWGWRAPWDKSLLINAKIETRTTFAHELASIRVPKIES